MHDPRIIANAVLRRAEARGYALTNLDLQKIVYLLHGGFLRQTGKPLVAGEFVAWEYGPVHRVLYDAAKSWGDTPVDRPLTKLDPIRRQRVPVPALDDPEVEEFLDANLGRFLVIPTYQLVQLTHAPGTPWSRTMEAAETRANVGMVISNDLIAQHYEGASVGEPGKTGGGRPSVQETVAALWQTGTTAA
jgi:uncharacterized phage-associated protein